MTTRSSALPPISSPGYAAVYGYHGEGPNGLPAVARAPVTSDNAAWKRSARTLATRTAHSILPPGVNDQMEAAQYGDELDSYMQTRDPGNGDVRSARAYEAQFRAAGQAPSNDERLMRRINNVASPRVLREAPDHVQEYFNGEPAAEPTPRPTVSSYNTLTHEVGDTQERGFAAKPPGHVVGVQAPDGITRRVQHEVMHHPAAERGRGWRAGTYGTHNTSRAQYNILSNVASRELTQSDENHHKRDNRRRTANHTEYSYDILSGEDQSHNPHAAIDPRARVDPSKYADSPPEKRHHRVAPQPSHHHYDPITLQSRQGNGVNGHSERPRGLGIPPHPVSEEASWSKSPRRGAHAPIRSYNIVSNEEQGARDSHRMGKADYEYSSNHFIQDGAGNPVKHMRSSIPEKYDHVAHVMAEDRPNSDASPRRQLKEVASTQKAQSDSMWGVITSDPHAPVVTKDAINVPRGRKHTVDLRSDPAHGRTDRVWFEDHKNASDMSSPRLSINSNARPADKFHLASAVDRNPVPTPPRVRAGPRDSVAGTVFGGNNGIFV